MVKTDFKYRIYSSISNGFFNQNNYLKIGVARGIRGFGILRQPFQSSYLITSSL